METGLGRHRAGLTDPRVERAEEHRPVEIVAIALRAVLCGADDRAAIETFGLRSVALIRSRRRLGDRIATGLRSYPSSRPPDAAALGRAIRDHRGIGNRSRRAPDIAFREAHSRSRTGRGPEAFAIVRPFALDLPGRDSARGSIVKERFPAALDGRYLGTVPAQLDD